MQRKWHLSFQNKTNFLNVKFITSIWGSSSNKTWYRFIVFMFLNIKFNMAAFGIGNPCSFKLTRDFWLNSVPRLGSIQNTAKSLDLLRQILQKSLNAEIEVILRKYVEVFWRIFICYFISENWSAFMLIWLLILLMQEALCCFMIICDRVLLYRSLSFYLLNAPWRRGVKIIVEQFLTEDTEWL